MADMAELTALARSVVAGERESSAERAPDFWRSLDLALGDRMRLLRILVRTEQGRHWEPNHWDELDWTLGLAMSFAGLTAEYIQAQPVAAFEQLLPWLGDDHRLADGLPSVRYVGNGLLFHHRHLAPDQLRALLATSPESGFLLPLLGGPAPGSRVRVAEPARDQRPGRQPPLTAPPADRPRPSRDDPAKLLDRLLAYSREHQQADQAEIERMVAAVRGRLDDRRFEERLLAEASHHPEFVPVLARWLMDNPELVCGERTTYLRDLLGNGWSPTSAWNAVRPAD